MLARFLAYGLFGCVVEYGFTIAVGRRRLPSPWMVPIYGLAAPVFPPLRNTVRTRPVVVRAAIYGAAMIAAEYAIGRAVRETVQAAPWSYSARFAVGGVTRLDYFPLWALYGLALEQLDAMLPTTS